MKWLDAELQGPVKKISENTKRLSGFLTTEKNITDLYTSDEVESLGKGTLELQLSTDVIYSEVCKDLGYLKRKYVKVCILLKTV